MKIINRPTKHYHIIPNQQHLTATKLNLKERGLLSIIMEFASIKNWRLNLNHLAKEAQMSLATIQKLIKSLIEKNWLTRERVYAPQGVQGSYCNYELNLNPSKTETLKLKKTKDEIVTEFFNDEDSNHEIGTDYFNDKDSNHEILTEKTPEHNNTDHNNTDHNNTDINNTDSNKQNIINLQSEINKKIDELIWNNLDELEEFHNLFIIHKAKMMNKLPGEVEGIYRKTEERINNRRANMSDITALKNWREGVYENTNFVKKDNLHAGFEQFTKDENMSDEQMEQFFATITDIPDGVNNYTEPVEDINEPEEPEEEIICGLPRSALDQLVDKCIELGEIKCERWDSWGVHGIQVDGFTFVPIEEWITKKLEEISKLMEDENNG